MIQPRALIQFFKTYTGNLVLFLILSAIALGLFYGVRVQFFQSDPPAEAARNTEEPELAGPVSVLRGGQEFNVSTPPRFGTNTAAVPPKVVLPLRLYSAPVQNAEKTRTSVSSRYAPYGRLIPCETILTIDSARIATPIVGLVLEDLYHNGRLIIPAGAEVHGRAQTDRSRQRIASENNWLIVWRTVGSMNGAELPVEGIALDMERRPTGGWELTDGSAGLRGDLIRSDNLAEIKLFAATFLGAAASGLQDTQTSYNPLTGEPRRTPLDSPKNAALQATSAIVNRYAEQIMQAIERDGFYVRVPAGKQFYLYVTQTIDLDVARRGRSLAVEPTTKGNP